MTGPITEGHSVTLRCRLCNDAGDILDRGEHARTITIGHDEIIPGLEALLRGRHAGYRGRHRIAASLAYGEHRSELVFEAVRENLPAGVELFPGAVLEPGGAAGRFQLRVVSLTERGAMLDGNHPLAGQDLEAEIEIIDVR